MKLFGKGGKLNIIDIIIILVLVAAIAVVAVKVLNKGSDTPGANDAVSEEPNLRFTVVCEQIQESLANNIIAELEQEEVTIDGTAASPRRIFNSNKLYDASVTAWETKPAKDGTVDLWLTVEGVSSDATGSYSLGVQDIRVGIAYNVKTVCIEISGTVYSMEPLHE